MGTCHLHFLRSGARCKSGSSMDIRDKNEFVFFMQRALEDTFNDCYIELYNILLRAFVAADKDYDGQVSEDEFEGLINNAASFPKKFGFDWWQGTVKEQFRAIDENGDGVISFDEWLNFAIKNYQSQSLPVAFDKMDKDAFVSECKEALNSGSESYKKVYWFCWKAFQAADADRDGQVTNSEFAAMINVATAAQKRLGLPAPYQTASERDSCFQQMDENADGSISFNEWLSFYMKDILAKTAAL